MTLEIAFVLVVLLATLGLLAFTRIGPDLVLVAAVTALLVTGVMDVQGALGGLANPGLASVAVLYIVVSGLTETGAAHMVGQRLLGKPTTVTAAQARLMLPIAGLSAFLNNTPLVAMFIPTVQDWARKAGISASKLLLPLSYAAILGGTCTIIGTSTNLVVSGMVSARTTLEPVGFFEIAWIGLPSAVIGILFVITSSRWLLPERRPALPQVADPREYALELMVEAKSSLVGRTIEEAGLRRLPGVFLAEIERDGTVLPAVAPTERLRAGDRLVFVGGVDSVVDLYKINGLVPAPDQVFKLDTPRPDRLLIEAVVSPTSPMVGQTIRDGRFRSRYDAVVVAVARGGKRIPGRIGDIELRPGDTLLLETRPAFAEQHRHSRDFMLVSEVHGSSPPRHGRAPVAMVIMVGMIAAATAGIHIVIAGLVAGGLMLLLRCTTGPAARRSIDWQVLTVIAAAVVLGEAVDTSGLAAYVAAAWLELADGDPWLTLVVIYGITMVLTEMITNNAAAVLVFPIAQAAAAALDVSFRPFIMAIMMAASASFATPIGYQTNLMVYGPGGYRFTDYLRIGLPLNLTLWLVATLLIPRIWPF